jgi:hypothetical protein
MLSLVALSAGGFADQEMSALVDIAKMLGLSPHVFQGSYRSGGSRGARRSARGKEAAEAEAQEGEGCPRGHSGRTAAKLDFRRLSSYQDEGRAWALVLEGLRTVGLCPGREERWRHVPGKNR